MQISEKLLFLNVFIVLNYIHTHTGIAQELDYFVDLGVKILWISPIFESPMDDTGYDVENYTTIDPIFGSMSDFEELISEMNKRGRFTCLRTFLACRIRLLNLIGSITVQKKKKKLKHFSDLKLLLEIVPNHSSYKCKWFSKSVRKHVKYDDYYVWQNASNQDQLGNSSVVPEPPNNWVSN